MQNATGDNPNLVSAEAQSVTVYRRSASEPDVRLMTELLWRGAPDGFIPFAVRGAHGFRELVSVPVKYLHHREQPWLPQLVERLPRDSYAGINPMYRCGIRTRQREVYRPAVIEGQHAEVLERALHANIASRERADSFIRTG